MKTASLRDTGAGPRKAGVVVLRPHGGEWRCLLLRAYRNWGFPKGEIDPGESPLDAAAREVLEETSVGDLDFCWGETFIDTAPRTGHKIARYYIAVSPGARVFLPVSAELGRPEHHEFRWVGLAAAKTLLAPALQPVIAWAATIAGTPHLPARPVSAAPARRSNDAP
jgi:bis(5'-nucleosidyl)-tetraphosphatase